MTDAEQCKQAFLERCQKIGLDPENKFDQNRIDMDWSVWKEAWKAAKGTPSAS